jgi:hypothetical protein
MLLYCVDVLQISFIGTSERGDHRINDQTPERKNLCQFFCTSCYYYRWCQVFCDKSFCDFCFTLRIQHITKPLFSAAIRCEKIQSDSQSCIDSLPFQSLNLMGLRISLGTGAFTWVPMGMRHYHH